MNYFEGKINRHVEKNIGFVDFLSIISFFRKKSSKTTVFLKLLDVGCSFICIGRKLDVVGFQKKQKISESVTFQGSYRLGKIVGSVVPFLCRFLPLKT
jgi:hypothetical protein